MMTDFAHERLTVNFSVSRLTIVAGLYCILTLIIALTA